MNLTAFNELFSTPSGGDGERPKFPVTVSGPGLVFASAVLIGTVLVLTFLGGGAFPWWQRGLWALALAVPAALRSSAGPGVTAWLGRVCFILSPFAALLVMERLSGRDIRGTQTVLSLALCWLAALVLWLLSGRTKLSAGVLLVLAWAAGMLDRFSLRLLDVLHTGTAGGAHLLPDALQLSATLAVLLALLVLAALPRQRERAPLCLSSFAAGMACAAFAVLFFATPALNYLDLGVDMYHGDGGLLLRFAFSLRETVLSAAGRYPLF